MNAIASVLAAIAQALATPQAASTQPAAPPREAPQQAAPEVGEEPATELEEIVVVGERLAEAVDAFVEEVAAPPKERGLARWRGRVCVGVVNLRAQAAQALVDRVSTVARDAGLESGEPGCRPHVLIIAADDGPAMARALVSRRPRAFRVGGSGMDRGGRALEVFQTSEAPVRWWHVSFPVDSFTGRRAVRIPGEAAAPVISVNTVSGMRARIRDDLRRVIIIVDFGRLASASFDQLSDYVAMVALAQIDPSAETRPYPTILNLFGDTPVPGGLTEWDLAYLSSLNEARNERILPHRQAEAITAALESSQEPVEDASDRR